MEANGSDHWFPVQEQHSPAHSVASNGLRTFLFTDAVSFQSYIYGVRTLTFTHLLLSVIFYRRGVVKRSAALIPILNMPYARVEVRKVPLGILALVVVLEIEGLGDADLQR